MKTTFTGIAIVIIICVAIHMVMTARGKGRLAGQVLAIQMASVLTAVLYIATMFAKKIEVATLFFGLFYASFDWLLFFILDFTLSYIRTNRKSKISTFSIILFSIIAFTDFLSMCINPFLGHEFVLVESTNAVFQMRYWASVETLLFQSHMFFCYLIAASIMFELVRKLVISPKDFRTPYVMDLSVVVSLLFLNFVQIYADVPVNFCVILYMLYAIWIYYFAYYVVPAQAERSMQIYVGRELDSAIICFDMERHCIRANRFARNLFKIMGNDFTAIEEYASAWLSEDAMHTPDLVEGEDIIEIDGEEHIFTQEFRRLRDQEGNIQGSYLKLDDRTNELRRVREQKWIATHDTLTGLLNRAAFFEEAANILRNNPIEPRYMIATNIKDFKLINDLFGQEFADSILARQAELLRNTTFKECISGRIGTDRFAMLIRKVDYDPETAKNALVMVRQVANDMQYTIRTQCGVYEIANAKENVQLMYDRALMAMQKLRDSDELISFYDTFMMEQLMHKKNVLAEFDYALESGQFCMFLQPQIDREGRVAGAEALARWQHPQKGLVPPFQFIPVLEEMGLIYRLDRYIWEEAAKKLKEWQNEGFTDSYISVNISTRDFYYSDLYITFTSLVKQYEIAPSRLKLEITETALMYSEEHLNVLQQLSDYGFCIEMDDFGSGYSSLNFLKTVHMDVLKVDMEFLRRTENVDRAKAIIASIIQMAKNLGMEVVTEGVEEQLHVEFLIEAGCDYLQGYYFSKPIPVEEYENKYMKEAAHE